VIIKPHQDLGRPSPRIYLFFASSRLRGKGRAQSTTKTRRREESRRGKFLPGYEGFPAWLLGDARSGLAAAATGHRHATERAVKTAGQKAAIANHSYSGASSKDAAQSSKMGGFYGVTPSADPYLPSYWYESPEQDFTKP